MFSSRRFEHIGHAPIRVERASAWGDMAPCRPMAHCFGHPRLRCGVLRHIANRTLSFHTDAGSCFSSVRVGLFRSTSSEIPSTGNWWFARRSCSISDPRDTRLVQVAVVPSVPPPPAVSPSPRLSSPPMSDPPRFEPPRLDPPRPDPQVNSRCRRSVFSAIGSSTCLVRYCQSQCTSLQRPEHSTGRASRSRACRVRGCAACVPRSCITGFCEAHCTSPRCRLHHRRLPVCSSPNCAVDASPCCVVGTCQAHCTHPQCGHARNGPRETHRSRPALCRVPSCSERAHPECSSRRCTLHCSSSRCSFRSSPNGMGAASR